jgi:DNA-binding GntR family transcriptional regulator
MPKRAGTAGPATEQLAEDVYGVLSKSGLGTQVADALRELILRGHFSPGDQLREPQLAESFGVSRGPVRDALTELAREGLVDVRPHRTATVTRLTTTDLEEIYSLRLALETLAVRCAARRVEPADLRDLEHAVSTLRQLASTRCTARDVARADLAFHDALYAAAGHRRLELAWRGLRSQIYVFLLTRNLTRRDFTTRLVADHEAILEAIRTHDETAAVRLVEEHAREPYLGLLAHEAGGRAEP